MKFGTVRNLLIATALAPALAGVALIGCDDSDDKPVADSGTTDTGVLPGDGGVGDGPVGDTAPVACTTANTTINGNIIVNTTWDCPTYFLKKIIYVANNATLTIKPGVTITADTAAMPHGGLVVARGSKLIANGTKEKPIVFTSANPVGTRTSGDFAGVVLLGSARLNGGDTCSDGSTAGACPAPAYWEKHIEGLPATEPLTKFGGNDDTNSCGEISYVRIEFAGTILSIGNELNGLTLGACGSGTKVSYLQVHRGKDDGVELFGGTANIDHVLVTAGEDDGIDWDNGWRGRAQFIIVHNWADVPKQTELQNGFEGDNLNGQEIAVPRSNPTIYNATLIGSPVVEGMNLRRGTRATIRNIIVQNYGLGVANVGWLNATIMPAEEWPTLLSVENSIFFGNGPYTDTVPPTGSTTDDLGFDEKASFENAARMNKLEVNPGITSVVDTAPNYTPSAAVAGQATPPAGFDVTATYAGAVAPGAVSWTEGWTAYPVN